jgi:hypothetical protein
MSGNSCCFWPTGFVHSREVQCVRKQSIRIDGIFFYFIGTVGTHFPRVPQVQALGVQTTKKTRSLRPLKATERRLQTFFSIATITTTATVMKYTAGRRDPGGALPCYEEPQGTVSCVRERERCTNSRLIDWIGCVGCGGRSHGCLLISGMLIRASGSCPRASAADIAQVSRTHSGRR